MENMQHANNVSFPGEKQFAFLFVHTTENECGKQLQYEMKWCRIHNE